MTTYERVVDGEVVERVTPIDGSHEDTRLGVLVLEGSSEWRRADSTAPVETSTPADDAMPPFPADDTTPAPEGADSAPDASEAGTNVSEEPDGAATTDGDGTGPGRDKPGGRRQRS